MSTRVYLSCSPGSLAAVVAAGGVGAPPLLAHAATDAVRRVLAADTEEEEYAAATAAAQAAIGLLRDAEPARRIVLAVDVPTVGDGSPDAEDPTLVEVDEAVPWRRVAAVLADSADAEAVVAAARDALRVGSPDAAEQAERCLDHELGWWAAQEVEVLLRELGATDPF